jgi:hypothetical protein
MTCSRLNTLILELARKALGRGKHHNSARGLSHRRALNYRAVIVFTFDEGYVCQVWVEAEMDPKSDCTPTFTA